MLKTISAFVLGAIAAAGIGVAVASVGQVPVNGFAVPDGTWLLGLAGGVNSSYQYGISAAGTTQATGTQLPSGMKWVEVDTAGASSGVNLPPCLPGTGLGIYNNGANTVTVYPAVANNPITAAQDTINSATSLSGGIATHAAELFFCAKGGNWAAK